MSQPIKPSKRDPYIDNARFVLVLLVVFGHLISPFKYENDVVYFINNFLTSFRMPALILLTGFFSKKFLDTGYIEKITIRLFVPFLIFQFLYNLDHWQSINWLMPSFGLWFLLSLYWWNLLLFIFTKLNKPVVTAIAAGIGIGLVEGAGHEFSLSRTFVFFPFFILGYYLNKGAFDVFKKEQAKKWGLLSAGLSVIILSLLPLDITRDFLLGRSSFETMNIGVLEGIGLRGVYYVVMGLGIVAFLPWIPKTTKPFTIGGRRTAFIYILHLPIMEWMRHNGWGSEFSLLLVCISLPLAYTIATILSQRIITDTAKYVVLGEAIIVFKKLMKQFPLSWKNYKEKRKTIQTNYS
ncbi:MULTISPECIES: acyltransferase family protein [Pontibacillus]|uniref:Acyltransferase family protein n=1 Tax=Pontibacillus chungwhensis TaxID=265426 RepID=A0ABY8V1H4_9BACI|nr:MULTISPECIES: acyltransferase family protein [Pontibacillus]MCD5324890.1 acyltransferase family protein [Pontibacillus sp. HN14]WIF98851.1 acyltransferase family protein [Pontibacillus chungwhensis]